MYNFHYDNTPILQHNTYKPCSIVDPVKTVNSNENNICMVPQNIFNSSPDDKISRVEVNKTQKPNTKSNKGNVDTSNYSIEERLIAAVWVHERERLRMSIGQIKTDFRQRFGREAPAKNTLLVWEKKLFTTGSVHDAPRPGRPLNRRAHVEAVRASVRAAPGLSLRARAAALRVPRTTLRTILTSDLPRAARGENSKDTSSRRQTRRRDPATTTAAAATAPPAPPAPLAHCAYRALAPVGHYTLSDHPFT